MSHMPFWKKLLAFSLTLEGAPDTLKSYFEKGNIFAFCSNPTVSI